ncbi:reverse transcriptase family protein [Sphingomonas sp. RHCKR7]|uniref:reverse transcriptase family protein n=1 Tax=Sphingomonas folli TaxID=2862497 RepID=UPI001CA4CC6F|nr:reverse transcriptase family protein [Sphingomonas folli]MBW6528532.1 reverse transcriptase family protein [Sphingomonas folli]
MTNREALIAAIGTDLATFDAVLDFVPPPRRVGSEAPETEKVQVLEIPVFLRHDIPKRRRKGEFRTAWEPVLAKSEYKALARRLDSFFRLTLAGFTHDCAFGFLPGRNIRENATVHSGHRHLLGVDVQDFFPTITRARIERLFTEVGVETSVAELLARFVTIGGSLPLGLPTSPVLSNAVSLPIDVACDALAARRGAVYTRYVDDMSFSSDDELPDVEDVRRILAENGFGLSERKTRRSRIGQAHYVTGLSVSDGVGPHVPRERKRRLRQELHYARKFGLADHLRHLGVNDDRVIQQQVNRLDGMVRFVVHHEPRIAPRLRTEWRALLKDNGMSPSFVPRGQHRAPFYMFIDEAEFDRDGERILALCIAITQHGPLIAGEGAAILAAAMTDPFSDGNVDALRRRGLHFADATEDLRLAYVTRLASMRFEGFVAFADLPDPAAYEETYLRLLGAMIERRLMAAESQYAYVFCEANDKVGRGGIEECVATAQRRLKDRDDRRPVGVGVEFVNKPHLGISVPDFLLGVLGRYLRSPPVPDGRPERRERLMFERLRDKYRLILDLTDWTEYSRRRPIRPWNDAGNDAP